MLPAAPVSRNDFDLSPLLLPALLTGWFSEQERTCAKPSECIGDAWGATRPISLRLAPCHINLKARAFTVSGTLTGVARELILTGLAGGDNKALADGLMHIERRLTALEGLAREVNEAAQHIDSVSCELRSNSMRCFRPSHQLRGVRDAQGED